MDLKLFTKSSQGKASDLLDEYDRYHILALRLTAKAEFKNAADYHRYVANTLDDLDRLKYEKSMCDQAREILRQVKLEEERRKRFEDMDH